MGRLDAEARMAIKALSARGSTQNAIARLLGVTEGTVRYHARRMAVGAADGRSRQRPKAAAYAAAIAHWRDQQDGGGVNLAALHDWLRREHGYDGSLRSVQRYWRRTFPAPAIRARRRVETPPGAQAQVDWPAFLTGIFVTAARGGVMLRRGCGAGIGHVCALRRGAIEVGVGQRPLLVLGVALLRAATTVASTICPPHGDVARSLEHRVEAPEQRLDGRDAADRGPRQRLAEAPHRVRVRHAVPPATGRGTA